MVLLAQLQHSGIRYTTSSRSLPQNLLIIEMNPFLGQNRNHPHGVSFSPLTERSGPTKALERLH